MLMLVVLFGLFMWIIITDLAMKIGAWLGKKTNHSKAGARIGFMLAMGWVFVYWALEFVYIQAQVAYLCHKEAGITVYVTPEEWRKQIGEAEWNKLYKYGRSEQYKFDRQNQQFDNIEFIQIAKINKYIMMYADWENIGRFVSKNTGLLVDNRNQRVLVKYVSISVGTGAWIAGGSPKFWLDSVQGCSYFREKGQTIIADQYSNLLLGVKDE